MVFIRIISKDINYSQVLIFGRNEITGMILLITRLMNVIETCLSKHP